MVGTTAVGFVKNVIKLTGNTMKAIDYEEENTKRVTALELTGGPAHGGLTVLDWFAGQAMTLLLGHEIKRRYDFDPESGGQMSREERRWLLEDAYDLAEAMMAERKKRNAAAPVVTGVTGKTYG